MKQFMGFLMVLGALLFLGNPVLAKEAPKKKAVKCAKCAAGKGCLKCAAKKCKAFKVVYLPCKACEGKMKCKKCKEKGGPCCAKCAKKALNPKCDQCKVMFVVSAKKCASCQKKAGKCTKCSKK
ncbi:MAG: hypothetical protein D6785_14675 [Planctomycetota bacterium]|nr:MAG: hypothetical protein D6785_14675 [Planctomycetota bacterium]